MDILVSTTNDFDGVVIDPQQLPATTDEFRERLLYSLDVWRGEGHQVVWLQVPIARSALIPAAVEAGLRFHHSGTDYLLLAHPLQPDAYIPPYATHYIGAGGVVINERHELLVVWEKAHHQNGRKYYKLPGGALQPGEHLVDAVIREVFEETGIQTRFESLICFRHWHGYRYGKSDIYFICRLLPLNAQIAAQPDEIAECLWMPVQDFLDNEHVGVFNRRIVEAALASRIYLAPQEIEGYSDPVRREIFMPQH
ncbi:MAG: NUDIX domain-containing protein [Anaerolineae bacterium]|nr:NUDIX domain-containing protein [Anaerolineae bacterium]